MKKGLLIKLTFLIAMGLFWMSNSGGRATSMGEANTGAPSEENTCSSPYCHGNASVSVDLDIAITDLDGNEVAAIIGGETYSVAVTVNYISGNTPSIYGYQMTVLSDSDNQSVGTFSNQGANVQVATLGNGRTYAEHNGASSSNVFEIDWTAPTESNGDVTFYAAGMGGDGNGNPNGDGGNETSLTLATFSVAVDNPITEKWNLMLYPNPVVDMINLTGNHHLEGSFMATIVDVTGKIVTSMTIQAEDGKMEIPSENIQSGNYNLMLQSENEIALIQFFKL